jgi:hypothetical protein
MAAEMQVKRREGYYDLRGFCYTPTPSSTCTNFCATEKIGGAAARARRDAMRSDAG